MINERLKTGSFASKTRTAMAKLFTKTKDFGEGSADNSSFPKQPDWFKDTSGFNNIEKGLKAVGFNDSEVSGILGNNWFNFYKNFIN